MPSRVIALTSRARPQVMGLGVCAAVAAVAVLLEAGEEQLLGHRVLDGLVLSLLIGIAFSAGGVPSERMRPGIGFAANPVLNAAVVLLGLTIDLRQFYGEQTTLIVLAMVSVLVGFSISLVVAGALRIPKRTGTLIATGSSICGNSAIAAAAPVIRANKSEVAAAISISALLGALQVVLFPVAKTWFSVSEFDYGFVTGMSVYSVPQTIAASFAVSSAAGEIATTTKLARVLMLGPMVIALGVAARRAGEQEGHSAGARRRIVPGFVLGFITMAVVGTLLEVPEDVVSRARTCAILLFSIAMAGVGMDVDVGELIRGAPRTGVAVLCSAVVMVGLGIASLGIYKF